MEAYVTQKVPERIEKLREELFSTQTRFCFERARAVTRSYRETEGEPASIRRAKALREVFETMPIFIREGELLVGQRAAVLAGRSVYPEYHLNGLTRETAPSEIWEYWAEKSISAITRRTYPERLKLAEREMAAGYVTGSGSGFGHVIVDYEKALHRGFAAIRREAEDALADTAESDPEGRAFLSSVVIACGGIISWANRYADLAESLAGGEGNPERREELLRISETCRRVPAYPARNFTEALQSFWFVHMAMHIEQYGWSISAGRFDQYMFPYYDKDLTGGALSQEQAWELLLSLWVKFMENVDTGVKNTTFQNLTLGGQDSQGRDQSNTLSILCLEATVALGFNQPALSVRWHEKIDPAFWNRVHETIAQGLGMPALFNDNVIIKGLSSHGVRPEDAVGYGIVGCVEPCIPGKEQGMTAGGHLNCAKALELALNAGRSMITGILIGEETRDPVEFEGFDDLWEAYREQAEYLAGLNVLSAHISGEVQKAHGACPLMSALLDDCLAKRRDMVHGGTRYNLPGVAIFGPANTCDAMMAVRKFVCEEKRLSWGELRDVLLNDYAGREDLRLLFSRRTPRYGNDIPEADALMNRINDVHARFFWKQVDSRNGRFTSGVWPVNSHVSAGHWTAATPDGRHKGAPLVDGVGACQGADRKGPTALLNSVARLNNIDHWTAGNTCNIKFTATSIRTGEAIGRMRDLAVTFMRLGGQELQINVVDAAILRDAMARPEEYSDLVVRVAGYSAYFTMLSADIQEEIISRAEHAV